MKIVLTGGPSAGKTTVVDLLYRTEWFQLTVVQEAASLLWRGGFPRAEDPVAIRCQQRAVYAVQRELEEIAALESLHRTILCDRGSLDGLAYWPGDEESFFKSIHSSMETEIARYDWVLHLDTASSPNYQSSDIRREDFDQAMKANEQVKHAWRLHPNRVFISSHLDFMTKTKIAVQVVTMILEGKDRESILRAAQNT
jgi:predicted ATPase